MKRRVILSAAKDLLLIAALSACSVDGGGVSTSAAKAPPASYGLGSPVDSAHLKVMDIDIDPTGAKLPAGSGNSTQGLVVYAAKCASCHGANGEGRAAVAAIPAAPGRPAVAGVAVAPKIVGREPREGFPFGRDPKLVKTVGNYWPYATTVYDYVHRAMPLATPGTLTPDETYAVVAWLLAANEIIPKDAVMDAKTLPAVKMPAAGRFVVDDRAGRTVK